MLLTQQKREIFLIGTVAFDQRAVLIVDPEIDLVDALHDLREEFDVFHTFIL